MVTSHLNLSSDIKPKTEKQPGSKRGIKVRGTQNDGVLAMTPLELEMVEFFVRAVQMLGFPKSVGEIYGLLFISERSLNMDDVMQKLNLSKGGTSQGFKQLRNMGAIRVVYVPGDRRDHYVAETELRQFAGGFIREQIQPQLAFWETRLGMLENAMKNGSDGNAHFLHERISKLNSWRQQMQRILPLINMVLGK